METKGIETQGMETKGIETQSIASLRPTPQTPNQTGTGQARPIQKDIF